MAGKEIERKFVEDLVEIERCWQSAEHFVKVILPVVKDQKLILRALETLHKGAVLAVSIVLKYEYLHGRVELYKQPGKNAEVFFSKCSGVYGMNFADKENLKKLLVLGKKHKESGFEFSRFGKMIILDDELKVNEVNKKNIEEFADVLRRLSQMIRNQFRAERRASINANI